MKGVSLLFSCLIIHKSEKSYKSWFRQLYDIIKAHGNGIKVETEEGEVSEFIIQLPKNI